MDVLLIHERASMHVAYAAQDELQRLHVAADGRAHEGAQAVLVGIAEQLGAVLEQRLRHANLAAMVELSQEYRKIPLARSMNSILAWQSPYGDDTFFEKPLAQIGTYTVADSIKFVEAAAGTAQCTACPGYDGAFGDADGRRFHYVSDPEVRREGAAVVYHLDMGRSRIDAIDDLVRRLGVLHASFPILQVVIGRGYLP